MKEWAKNIQEKQKRKDQQGMAESNLLHLTIEQTHICHDVTEKIDDDRGDFFFFFWMLQVATDR